MIVKTVLFMIIVFDLSGHGRHFTATGLYVYKGITN
ncbi:hypothetical protein PvtlMGM1_1190, partial [Prevotella sp. MGM1]